MPCYTEPPTHDETLRRDLNALLDEIGDSEPKVSGFFLGASRDLTLDAMAARLCAWCSANNVTAKSLELQIWWRDHQRWDATRKADEERAEYQPTVLGYLEEIHALAESRRNGGSHLGRLEHIEGIAAAALQLCRDEAQDGATTRSGTAEQTKSLQRNDGIISDVE